MKRDGMKRTALLLLMGILPAFAIGAVSSEDESFYKSAAEGGLAEVAAGKLAEDKAASPQVKDFGGMMVKDHSTADAKLWKIAGDAGVKLPTTPGVEQVAASERLKLLSGPSFDKAYIKNQIEAHRDTVALLRKEIASGHDAAARQFATDTLPTVQGHLEKIMQIAGTAGVSAD